MFGLIVLKWDLGRAVVKCAGDKARKKHKAIIVMLVTFFTHFNVQISAFLAFTDSGSSFLYGWLVTKQMFNLKVLEPNTTAYEVASTINETKAMNFVLFFKTLSNVYFFGFCIYMLFYLGAVQWLVEKLGKGLQVEATYI